MVIGYKARFGALLLLVFLVLDHDFHNFWALSDPKDQQEQMVQFMKNLSMMGTMLLIIAAGSWPASLDSVCCIPKSSSKRGAQ